MSTMHESYKPGDLIEVTLDDGANIVLGSVIENDWKCLGHIYSAKLPDGSFVAFDARKLQQFADAFNGVSRAVQARLEALALATSHHFKSREDFFASLVGVADKMAACPATDLH